jgi:nucleotide-binding universal stress UspA family protein
MLKSVLVLLGETPSSISARQYAFRLARETGAELTGLSGIDLAFIEAPKAVPIGGTAYKVRREKELKKQADTARNRLHGLFADECKAQSVPFGWLSFEGDPMPALYLAIETRDLVVTGHDTAYYGNVRENLPEMLAKLVMTSPRPTILCADELSKGNDILVAYDGSLPSMRAVQIFALLGMATDRRVHVTSIEAGQELAVRKACGAAAYLESHGFRVETDPIASSAAPAEVIRAEVADRKIATIVMGAYGHRGWREFLFGSTTRRLTEAPPCALFIYH